MAEACTKEIYTRLENSSSKDPTFVGSSSKQKETEQSFATNVMIMMVALIFLPWVEWIFITGEFTSSFQPEASTKLFNKLYFNENILFVIEI